MEPCESSLTSALFWALCSLAQITPSAHPPSKLRPTVDHRISCTDIARSCSDIWVPSFVRMRKISTEDVRDSSVVNSNKSRARTCVFGIFTMVFQLNQGRPPETWNWMDTGKGLWMDGYHCLYHAGVFDKWNMMWIVWYSLLSHHSRIKVL